MQHTPQDDAALEADPATGPAALTPAEVDEFVHQINTFEASSVSLEGRVSKGRLDRRGHRRRRAGRALRQPRGQADVRGAR